MNPESDWILLKSDQDLCDNEPSWGPVVDFRRYIQLGLSENTQNESPFSVSIGVVSSECPNDLGHTLGSSGVDPGEAGGGCFDESSGCLIGINVGKGVPFNFNSATSSQMYDKVSSRYSSRARIIPIFGITIF